MIKKFILLLMIIMGNLAYGGELKEALFAGGCFWSMEKSFEGISGVESVVSGYAGKSVTVNNKKKKPIEVIHITYDPSMVTYEELLKLYWKQVDPTDGEGQFVDRGYQYSPAVFYYDKEQKQAAVNSKTDLETRGVYEKPIVAPVLIAPKFYPAKEYHQNYSKKNPIKYQYSRIKSGRDEFLDDIWGKDRKDVGVRELKSN
ncbi:peptide-methionine (S)-S-oxide reductase MsrA [Psychrilyobacter atlanticus]|uniref:peptide-methionine (S)-S-oxide reductase MsrA n=1 Tax=Psychrilyobacter atlanticus TaxID=271091 RepID=UPI000429D875|nr:peptide-methionine (S)-S-oxide reductase MsrA [Psychrilyobacter atlanticus]